MPTTSLTNAGRWRSVVEKVLYWFSIAAALLHLANNAFAIIPSYRMRPLHLAILITVCVLVDISKAGKGKHTALRVAVGVLIFICGWVGVSQLLLNYEEIALTAGKVTTEITICAALLVFAILYLTWQRVGKALVIVAVVFLLYALFGNYIPGVLGHRGYGFKRLMYFLYTNGNGIFGTAIDTSARYMVLFMIMGNFIEFSGTTKFFAAVAKLVSSKTRGGAAKSSVVASALFGSISGTPIANVLVTGAFTIPMMKKSGFKDEFAAGVEATASTGGLIMPPMMGAGAFVMAEVLGISYNAVLICAIIPALLYYFSIYLSVDFFAAKNNIGKVTDLDMEEVMRDIKLYWPSVIPLASFIVSVVMGYSVFRSALICIVITPFIAALRKETRMNVRMVVDCIGNGLKTCVNVTMACACAGLIIGSVALTGFGFSFSALLKLFAEIPFLALLITMLVCLVLGMGMPAIASYMITSTIAATSLVDLGFTPLAVHMFVFYFSCFSSVTPPVALASYAAAGVAQCNPMKTGFQAFKLALVAFIVPYFFVYSPALIGQGTFLNIIGVLPAAVFGTYAFVCGLSGYIFDRPIKNIILRAVVFAGGMLMIMPGLTTDLIGLAMVCLSYLLLRFSVKPTVAGV